VVEQLSEVMQDAVPVVLAGPTFLDQLALAQVYLDQTDCMQSGKWMSARLQEHLQWLTWHLPLLQNAPPLLSAAGS